DDDSRKKGGQEVNVGQIGDGKAAEKERVPYNFDDVVGGEQEKKKRGHHADTPGLAGPDVKKARQNIGQRKVIHEINWIAILRRSILCGRFLTIATSFICLQMPIGQLQQRAI